MGVLEDLNGITGYFRRFQGFPWMLFGYMRFQKFSRKFQWIIVVFQRKSDAFKGVSELSRGL